MSRDPRAVRAPSRGRGRGGAEPVSYRIEPVEEGFLLVAAGRRGILRVALGRDAGSLVAALQRRFPEARPDDDSRLAAAARRIRRYLRDAATPLDDLPVALQGTPFQIRVWEELRRIPRGETRSYGEIAALIGAPRAARAVGAACGANPLLFLVPCHRVVAKDGIGGFGGLGPAFKRRLLAAERRAKARTSA